LFTDPGMRIMWTIAGVVALLTLLAARFAPQPKDARPQIREAVQEVIGIPGSTKPRLIMWRAWAFILPVICLGAGMILLTHSTLNRTSNLPSWLLLAVAFLPKFLIVNARTRGWRGIYQSLCRADYDEALARADRLLRWFPENPVFHFMRGTTLHYAGRLPEAEQALRTSLQRGQVRPGPAQAIGLATLGEVLLAQDRLKDATAAFQASSKIYPGYGSAYSGLAEVCLRQQDAQRALQLADQALELRQLNAKTRKIDRHTLASMWADRAQALALLGRNTEAATALEKAASTGDPKFLPGLAGTLWRCGVALLHMDRVSAAVEQFHRAAQIDPYGRYGNLSASALREQSVGR
jgi:Flp pilus assembly protein TadD